MKKPLISIYITSHNYSKFVASAIESALNQSYKETEIIVYDDCSDDGSQEIIKTFEKNTSIRIFYGKKKLGLRAASNFCIKKSNGEFVIRLDADDLIHENYLELAVNKINAIENLAYIFSNYFYIDSDANILGVEVIPTKQGKYEAISFPPHGAGCIVKKSIFEQYGFYSETVARQDGHELWMTVIKHKLNFTHIDLPLFFYRKHGTSLSSKKELIYKDRAIIKERINSPQKKKNICFIPIRKNIFDLFDPIKTNVLEKIIGQIVKSRKFERIIVSTDSNQIIHYVQGFPHVEFHNRQELVKNRKFEIMDAIKDFCELNKVNLDDEGYLVILNLTNIRLKHNHISEAINSMDIYDLDSLVSVFVEESVLYRMDHKGLIPINYDNQFKLRSERDAVYIHNGALKVFKIINLFRANPYVNKIGHVEMTREDSIFIKNKYESEFYLN